MGKKRTRQFPNCVLLLLIIPVALLSSCSPSQEKMDVTRTQVADSIYGTQTVQASTSTVTLTPTITNTLLPSRTPTKTPGPTVTPYPTYTPDPERVERMKLCYKAAMIVYTDLQALYMDDAWLSDYRTIDENALRALQTERKSRYTSLVKNIEICTFPGTEFEYCHNEDVLSVDGIVLSSGVCLGYEKRINSCNTFLQVVKITGGVGMTPHQSAEMQCNNISTAVQDLEEALLISYGINQEELDAIAEPFWQNVHKRYGVVIPVGN